MIEYRRQALRGSSERRVRIEQIELRDDGTNNLQLVGTPIVYDVAYSVRDSLGLFNETMAPGVVTDLLANGCDTRFLFNHGGLPLARTVSGTLSLKDSSRCLTCVANLDARQQLATDLAIAVERGDVNQMSIGMIVGEDEWDAKQENRTIFKLTDLLDVSAVTFPASPTTSIAINSGAEARATSLLAAPRTTTQDLRRELERINRQRFTRLRIVADLASIERRRADRERQIKGAKRA